MDDSDHVLYFVAIILLIAFFAAMIVTDENIYDDEMKKLCAENSTTGELWNTGKLTQIKKIMKFKINEDVIQIYEYDRIFKFPCKIVYKNNTFLYTDYKFEKPDGDADAGGTETVKPVWKRDSYIINKQTSTKYIQ